MEKPGSRKGRPNHSPEFRRRLAMAACDPGVSESGHPNLAGMQRAHTLGQGTGFESPFGIYYAPAEVNQIVQNNGLEELFRGFRDKALANATFHVSTLTTAHPNSLRLKEIRYRLELERGGKKDFLFEYVINVGNDVPYPTVTHGVANITDNPTLGQYFGLVDVPERLRRRFARFRR
jgi:transposase-like protein